MNKQEQRDLLQLHIILFIYSLCGIFSKQAATQVFFSIPFLVYYCLNILMLGIYAIGWQQVIKRLPLTLAFANKAVTVIWGIIWGVVFFGETVTPKMLIGAVFVAAGVILFAVSDKEKK